MQYLPALSVFVICILALHRVGAAADAGSTTNRRSGVPDSKAVYLTGLPYTMTKADVTELLSKFGGVQEVKLIGTRDEGAVSKLSLLCALLWALASIKSVPASWSYGLTCRHLPSTITHQR